MSIMYGMSIMESVSRNAHRGMTGPIAINVAGNAACPKRQAVFYVHFQIEKNLR